MITLNKDIIQSEFSDWMTPKTKENSLPIMKAFEEGDYTSPGHLSISVVNYPSVFLPDSQKAKIINGNLTELITAAVMHSDGFHVSKLPKKMKGDMVVYDNKKCVVIEVKRTFRDRIKEAYYESDYWMDQGIDYVFVHVGSEKLPTKALSKFSKSVSLKNYDEVNDLCQWLRNE
jgi:hypothetical protein